MKTLKLIGIRKRAILCRFNNYAKEVAVMIPLTDEQVEELETNRKIIINDKTITSDNIYCYGDIDLSDKENVEYIKKFNLINQDDFSNTIHSNFNYEEGIVKYEGKIPKTYSTDNVILWFKYNHLLIGKPKNVLIYRCKKVDL